MGVAADLYSVPLGITLSKWTLDYSALKDKTAHAYMELSMHVTYI